MGGGTRAPDPCGPHVLHAGSAGAVVTPLLSVCDFLCMFPVAVVRFSSGGVAMRYVFPVL